MADYIEFSRQIKEKYPQYKDVDDLKLAKAMIEKYPQYESKVSFDTPITQPKEKQSNFNPFNATAEELNNEYKRQGQEKLNKRIEWEEKHPIISRLQADYQPFYRSDRTAMERQAQYGYDEPIGEALKNTGKEIGQAIVPYINAGRDAALSTVGGGSNVSGRIGVNAGIGALQGASSEALDELSNNGLSGNVLKRAGEGGLLGGISGGVVSGGLEGVNALRGGLRNLIDNPEVQNKVTKGLEALTSVPQEYSQRALDAELAGSSLFKGKFNEKTAYRPIEEKLRTAKSLLPSPESYADEFYKLGQKAKTGIENIKEAAGQEISDMLGILKAEPINIQGLKNSLNTLIKGYARGGNINPAEVRAGRDIEMVRDLLGIKTDEQLTQDLSNYFANNRLLKDTSGVLSQADKEAQDVAFSILSRATGKNKQWLKSQLNANLPKMSTQKRQEFIQNLLENTDDKIEIGTIDPTWIEHFPELNQVGEQYGISGRELAENAFNKIMRKDFKNAANVYDNEMNQLFNDLDKRYDKVLYNLTKNPSRQGIDNAFVEFDKAFVGLEPGIKEQYINKLAEDIDNILNMGNSKIKPIDLHNAKEIIYDMANYDTAGGTRNDVLKSVANQINNFIRTKYPQYKVPNDRFSMIKTLEKNLGGINSSTIANKLSNYGSSGNIASGLDQRLRDINNILPEQSRFIDQTKNLVDSQNEVNNINKLINTSYERNPRLLSNINDTAREEALESLQKMTGVNFMDELNDIRAREALEKLAPGQGGGSGNTEGFMNNVVRPALMAAPRTITASVLGNIFGGPIGAAAGLAMVSPKIMAQGTIRNLGRIYRGLGQQVPEAVQRLLNPLAVRMTTPMLYGRISND